MKQREYLLSLYEIYNKLLTEKERDFFEYYYFEDYSLNEIANNYKVSKSYVGKLLNTIEDKLIHYEECLNINEKNNKIKKLIFDVDKKTKDAIIELL